MAYKSIAIGEFYHVYNRGVDKRDVFLSNTDYERFLALMYACNNIDPVNLEYSGTKLEQLKSKLQRKPIVSLCAYCLMTNHFHMLLYEKQSGGISLFMQKLMTGYTMYFNRKYDRSGALFQGRFKAKHIDNDVYLSYISAYIHLNPLSNIEQKRKAEGIRDLENTQSYLSSFPYSSYPDYCGQNRTAGILLQKDSLPEFLENPRRFKENVNDWLNKRLNL